MSAIATKRTGTKGGEEAVLTKKVGELEKAREIDGDSGIDVNSYAVVLPSGMRGELNAMLSPEDPNRVAVVLISPDKPTPEDCQLVAEKFGARLQVNAESSYYLTSFQIAPEEPKS